MGACPPPTPPATVADFKARWGPRDFRYGSGYDTVMDADITSAFADSMHVYKPALFSPAEGKDAFLYLAAHYVRTNIQAVGGLVAGGTPEGLGVENQAEQVLSGAGVSGVNTTYIEPPERVKRNPIFLPLWNTTYGQKYVGMALPKTTGAVGSVGGAVERDTTTLPWMPFADD